MSNIKINDLDDEEICEETDLMGSFMESINMDDIDINDEDEPDFDEEEIVTEPIKVVEVEPSPKKKPVHQKSDTKKVKSSEEVRQLQEKIREQEAENRKLFEKNQKEAAENQKRAEELQQQQKEMQRQLNELKQKEKEHKQREQQLKQEKKESMEEENRSNQFNETDEQSDENATYTGNAYQQAKENDFEQTQQAQTEPASDEDMENAYDPENNRRNWNNMNHIIQNGRFGKILKKGLVLVVAILICVIIPVAVVNIGGKLLTKDKSKDSQATTQETEYMINVFGTGNQQSETPSDTSQSETVLTETPATANTESSTASAPSVNVQIDVPEVSGEKKNLSSRFPTLNDLSLYINSSTATILMNEKKAMTDYVNGSISQEECLNKLQACTNASNEILHLLAVNKSLYTEQGQAQQYTSLESDLISVMYYGDVATGLINNNATIPQIIQGLNMQ